MSSAPNQIFRVFTRTAAPLLVFSVLAGAMQSANAASLTIDIKGKCKSIVVDGCKKTKVLFDTAMASCEVINCSRMQIQCRQKVAAVAIDKTDGIIVFLPATSLGKTHFYHYALTSYMGYTI